MNTTHDPSRRVAIVTGASSGIGRVTAVQFARKGYAVALAARREDRLEAVAEQCRAEGAEALVVVTDMAEPEQIRALLDRTLDAWGRLDVLVNNAGFGICARVHETDLDAFRRILDVNVTGLFWACHEAAPILIAQGSGHIFNVSSVIGKRGAPFHGAYSATKHAVCGLSDALRVELAPYGIHVTTVCPALTDTEFFDHNRGPARDAKSQFVRGQTPMPPEIVARKIAAVAGRRQPELVFSVGGKVLNWIATISPRLADRIMKVYYDALAKHTKGKL